MGNTQSKNYKMADHLHLYICEHFKTDTLAVLYSGNFSDVKPIFIPSRCSRPIPANRPLSELALLRKDKNDDTLFCTCSCISASDKDFLDNENIKQLHLVNCFQMVAPQSQINKLISDGVYLITSGWLDKWREWVMEWGEIEQVRQMFSESVSKLVLLDTGVNSMCDDKLKELSAYINCPYEIIEVGLDYYQNYLENKILKWRLEKINRVIANNNKKENKQESDYAMALDLLTNLPRAEKEEVVANRIMEILVMMFAAQKISYISMVDAEPINHWSIPANYEQNGIKERLLEKSQPIKLTESGKGFVMNIGREDQILAVIEVDDIAFPENMAKYQNLAVAMAGVFALAIENSRYFQSMLEMNETLTKHNATKDKLFSIIAHDLRGPFHVILGYVRLLSDEIRTSDMEAIEKDISIINSSVRNTLVLLDNLLNWAKSQTGQISFNPENLKLRLVIDETIHVLNSSAAIKNIALNYFLPEEIDVYADLNLLKIVLRNLVSNALKFTNLNGKVDVYALRKNDFIEITVSDNGVGIDNVNQNKLFKLETSETTLGTAKEGGSGLGLILCKEIVEKHGGKIWVKSEQGKGSDFKFSLPINNEKKVLKI